MNTNKVLVLILAHPDDESFAFSGLIQKAYQAGYTVLLHTLTRGEASTLRYGLKDSDNLGRVRAEELSNVCRLLKIQLTQYDIGDGKLSKNSDIVTNTISKIVQEYPGAIFSTSYHKTTSHADHQMISTVLEKVGPRNLFFQFRPDRYAADKSIYFQIKLSDQESQIKKSALRCHKSQKPDIERYLDKYQSYEYFFVPKMTPEIEGFIALCGDTSL